jgi:hypothetical protein
VIERGTLSTVYAEERDDGDALLAREAEAASRPAGLLGSLRWAVARWFRRRAA